MFLLAGICGCPPTPPRGPVPPRSRWQALAAINENASKINQPLAWSATASFRFQDENRKEHSFTQDAALAYIQPRYLLFDVRSLGGTVAEFGSNEREFWLWMNVPDFRKLWRGDWDRIGPGTERKLPVPPNELLDALMLRPLTTTLEGGLLPVMRIEKNDFKLEFIRLGADRQPIGWREIQLDPYTYLPIHVVDRTPEGDVLMDARLSKYERVGQDGPLTPRRYDVTWPLNQAELRLDVHRAAFKPELDLGIFESPDRWPGEVERIDGPNAGSPAGTQQP